MRIINKVNIKRSLDKDVSASQGHNIMDKNKRIKGESQNYFHPLQTIIDEEENNSIIENEIKVIVPPITILKCSIDQIHDLCKKSQIKDYSIRKISIGLKLFCTNKEEYDIICEKLNNNFEFFTYGTKDDRPYKAVLLGLENVDPIGLKKHLTQLGLKCLDVKMIRKSTDGQNTQTIYIVYFQRKTITIRELRQKFSTIEYIKVRWEFQRPKINKITQCYNCQMFGHGSSRCKVRTFCVNCAGNHKSNECNSLIIKCANCNGNHRALSPDCPNRENFLEIKKRIQERRPLRRNDGNTKNNISSLNKKSYNANFPNLLNQTTHSKTPTWTAPRNTNDNDLFSFEELKDLTMELISKLQNCKSRADQFEVVTSLACKFLYR